MSWAFVEENNAIANYYELNYQGYSAQLKYDEGYSQWRLDLFFDSNLIDNQYNTNPAILRGTAEDLIFKAIANI